MKNYKISDKQLSGRIKTIRKKSGLTQEEVAEKIGYSRSMYARIENGLTSPLVYLDKLVEVLGEDIISIFPFDVNSYTNHRLLLYMLLFGVDYNAVGKAFGGMNSSQIKKLIQNPKKKYLLKYKEQIDMLFPKKDEVSCYDDFTKTGNNSMECIINGKIYVLMNSLGNGSKDTLLNLLK